MVKHLKLYHVLTLIALVFLSLATACRGAKAPPTEKPTAEKPYLSPQTASPYPGSGSYPTPGAFTPAETLTAGPYPVGSAAYPYPGNDQTILPLIQGNAYPDGELQPYPGGGETIPGEPTLEATLTPSPTLVAPTPTLTPTPSVTPTPTATLPVRLEFLPTDPSQVKLASGNVQLVEFYAPWSVTSRAMAPLIHAFENEFSNRMNFIYLNTDDPATTGLKQSLHFRSQPHFLLVDPKGAVLHEWVGFVDESELRLAFETALKN